MMANPLVISAVGDIAFCGRNVDSLSPAVFAALSPIFQSSDLVVANLENPLVSDGKSVPGKCTLRGNPGWARLMCESGINLVSLANNHLMDYGEEGLASTMRALDEAGVRFVGAGRNIEEANAPLFVNVGSRRVAVLARTSVEVSSPSYASATRPGVAFFVENETARAIKASKERADIVVLMMHWGLEHYCYPSPEQRKLAQRLVEAGVDIILGHHAHVLQGLEKIGSSLVSYSSGNFLFDEFSWSADINDQVCSFYSSLAEENRKGVVLQIDCSVNGKFNFTEIGTRICSDATVTVDSVDRKQHFDKLSRRLAWPLYKSFWKVYAYKREWDLRLKQQFALRRLINNFYKIRPRHVVGLVRSVVKSSNVAAEKSTNPYER